MRSAPLIGFQIRSGSRFALLELAPLFGALSAVILAMGPGLVRTLAAVLFPLDLEASLRAAPVPGMATVLIAALFMAVAIVAKQRLLGGAQGLVLHLPLTRAEVRRSLVVGMTVSCSAVVASLLVLRGVRWFETEGMAAASVGLLVTLLQLLCVGAGVSIAVLPVKLVARFVALSSALVATSGALGLLLSLVGLFLADRWSGALSGKRMQAGPESLETRFELLPLPLVLSLRVLPLRVWLEMLLALLPLAGAALFIHNNELTLVHIRLAQRLGTALALTFVLASFAEAIHRNRPPARFLRSLPWSARRRVGSDVQLFVLLALPVLVLCCAVYPQVSATSVVVMVLLSIRAASAVRSPSRLGSGADLLIEGSLASALVALVPWMWVVLIALCPVAVELAASRDRNLSSVRRIQ